MEFTFDDLGYGMKVALGIYHIQREEGEEVTSERLTRKLGDKGVSGDEIESGLKELEGCNAIEMDGDLGSEDFYCNLPWGSLPPRFISGIGEEYEDLWEENE